jgi:hypothetical protein
MTRIILLFLIVFISGTLYSQGTIYDDFSKKDLSAWNWGGMEVKYSHETDNKENGFLEIFTKSTVKQSTYIGKVFKVSPMLFSAGNYINLMFQGVNNDVFVKVSLLYDIDNNNKFNEEKDIMLVSKPITLNYSGWKEVKIKLDEENFKLVSKFDDNFSVTEEETFGIQFEFETGKNFKEKKVETGLALISEIPSKESFTHKEDSGTDLSSEKESYFDAKNYPNPFNPTTTISYTLKENTYVKLTVYDRLGREVKTLVDENKSAGNHTIEFTASGLPSGIYFYRIKTNERTEVKKMILAK